MDKTIQFVEGYLALGMADEALAELGRLPAHMGDRADILMLKGHCLLKLERWEEGAALYDRLAGLDPGEAEAYLHKAFCLHELKRTAEARQTLLNQSGLLEGKALFHYNLACYECQLGRLDAAIEQLSRAVCLSPDFSKTWTRDPDLRPLVEKGVQI